MAAALVGCSKDKSDKPAELVPLKNLIDIKTVWHSKLGGEKPILRLGLSAAVDEDQVFAASYKGHVDAFALGSGKELWQRSLKAPLSAGPGAGDGLVVVGSSKGDVIALSAKNGAQQWRVRINAEILSAPAVGGGYVVVRGVDGRLHGLSSKDGSEFWVIDQQVPRLSLRGTSRPLLSGDLAICGFDNGRVVAVTTSSGSSAWEAAVGQSHGSTELQRLIDVDAAVVSDGDDLFAVAYQGRVAQARAGQRPDPMGARSLEFPRPGSGCERSLCIHGRWRAGAARSAHRHRAMAAEVPGAPAAVAAGDLSRARRGCRFRRLRPLVRRRHRRSDRRAC